MKGLIVLYGGAARAWTKPRKINLDLNQDLSQHDIASKDYPEIYNIKSIENQKLATATHHLFFKTIEKKFNISLDKAIISYQNILTDDLLKKDYNFLEKYSIFKPSIFQRRGIIFTSVSEWFKEHAFNLKYEFIFFLRIDIALKPYFFDNFNPFDEKIKFCFPVYLQQESYTGMVNGDVLFFIPKSYFKKIDTFYPFHNCWEKLLTSSSITTKDIKFYINTFHYVNTLYNWNPLFWMPHRFISYKKINRIWKNSFISNPTRVPFKENIIDMTHFCNYNDKYNGVFNDNFCGEIEKLFSVNNSLRVFLNRELYSEHVF